MGPWLLALLPLLESAFADGPALVALSEAIATEGAGTALSAVTIGEWLAIAEKVAVAAPAMQRAWAALHPAFDELVADAKIDIHRAARNAAAKFAPSRISGYGADGAVTAIANPDEK